MIFFNKVLNISFASSSPKAENKAKYIFASVSKFIDDLLLSAYLKNFQKILLCLFVFSCSPAFAGGYFAVDYRKENFSDATEGEAIAFLIYLFFILTYVFLKHRSNKFVNDNENKILLFLFPVLPVILFLVIYLNL